LDFVCINEEERQFFLNNQRFVHPGDSFMIVSGNQSPSDLRTNFINETAGILHSTFQGITCYAATGGAQNVRTCADNLDSSKVKGIMIVWELDRPDHPDRAFNDGNRNETMRVTRNVWGPLRTYCTARGFEFWGKPSGRATKGGSKEDVYDYGEMATLTDGLNVQTQGSCQDGTGRFRQAINGLIDDYNRVGASGVKGLFPQVTVSTLDANSVTPGRGLDCCEYAWSRMPPVTRMTAWWAEDDPGSLRRFLELREGLFPASTGVGRLTKDRISLRPMRRSNGYRNSR
jgi:hypothetical protein